MFNQVLSCLTTQHDYRLVVGAALVCLTATVTAMRLFSRAWKPGSSAHVCLLLAGAVGGSGVWATHFIAMLAFKPGLPISYEMSGTLASLVLVIVGMGAGFIIAVGGRTAAWRALGGGVAGAAVAAMHFTGMTAMEIQGRLSWDEPTAAVAVAAGALLSAAALVLGARDDRWRSTLIAAAILTLGICSLHFTAMGAAVITLDPTAAAPDALLSRGRLAAGVGGLSILIGVVAIFVTIMERWSRSSALVRLREAIDAMPDGLAFYDANDRLVIWNARYAEINPEIQPLLEVGRPFQEILKAGITKGHYSEAIGREDEWLNQRLEARRQTSCTLEQQTTDDRWLRVQDRRTADGGVVTIINEITDLKRDARALKKARDSAEAANRAKSEFLANMSHEIRTPLNGVIGVAQVLARTDLDESQREMLELVRSSGVTLQQLLSDILDLARVESGRMELRSEPFDLAQTVREAGQLYSAAAADKGLQFFVDIAPEAQVWVTGDMVRLKQVLTNLVSNAVKFTSRGFVSLTVAIAGDRDGATAFRFTVEDTGVGFDASDKNRLFSRFEQADGSITRRFGGSGLGLAICRQLATMMGGELDCESEPEGGSAFILILPLAVAQAPVAVETEAPIACEGCRLRVLLADDHPTNRRVIELILSQTNVDLTVVEDGAQAVDAFGAERFDVVLMDMQMPVMDGLTATREIRLLEQAAGRPRTPIVMLTANALPEHVHAAESAGADRHMSKPINAQTLLETVAELATPMAAARRNAEAA